MIDRLIKPLTSLRLTVVLLCAALVLVFVGTLAQVHEGLYAAQVRYFKSWLVVNPTIGDSRWPIILPGGYLIGTLLLVNLLAAHYKRFTFTSKKIGIFIIHAGIIILLLGQLLTDALSHESAMRIGEGQTRNYSEDFRANELAIIDASDPRADRVYSIPESYLVHKADINDGTLPFRVRIRDYWVNCDLQNPPPPNAISTGADHGLYTNVVLAPDPAAALAISAVLVEVTSDRGVSLGMYFVPARESEQQTVQSGDRQWTLSLVFAPMMGGNQLIISDPSATDNKNMVAIPESEFAAKKPIHRDGLPVTLQVKEYWPKCVLFRKPGRDAFIPPATQGALAGAMVLPGAPVTDQEHRDAPGALVEIIGDKGTLGSWLVWSTEDRPPDVFLFDGKPFQISFRSKRYYQPYSIGLIKFTHEIYAGTTIPKNFASRVRVINPRNNEDREVNIHMNSPLRYAGTTYYQSSFDERDPRMTYSILQVVANPSWLTPYFACLMVGAGLIIQFGMHLTGFIRRRQTS